MSEAAQEAGPNLNEADLAAFGLGEDDPSVAVVSQEPEGEAELGAGDETSMAEGDGEPAEGAEAAEEGAEDAEETSEEPPAKDDGEPEEGAPVGAWVRFKKQADRYRRQGREALAQVQTERQALEQERAQVERQRGEVARYEGMANAVKAGDFDSIVQAAAVMAGLDYTRVMEGWIEQMADGGKPKPPEKPPENPEVAALKAEIEAMKAEQQQRAASKAFDADVSKMMTVKSDPSISRLFPNAAKLPEPLLRAELASAARYCQAEAAKGGRKEWSLDNAVAMVDKYAAQLYAEHQGQVQPAPASPTKTPPGQGNRAPAKPAKPSQSVTNQGAAAANAGTQRRDLTMEERIRLADQRAAEGAGAVIDDGEWSPTTPDPATKFDSQF